jgi:hypothetical protein
VAINPNWPLIEDGWAPYWNANGGAPWDRFTEVTGRTMGSGGTQRGRQYELDQVRTGELSTTLANTDGILDPTNTSGPVLRPHCALPALPQTRDVAAVHQPVVADHGDWR